MPFIHIEASPNMRDRLNADALVQTVYNSALSTDQIASKYLRCWLTFADSHKTADGSPDNGFIHVGILFRLGRTQESLKFISEKVFDDLRQFLDEDYLSNPLAISLEVRECAVDMLFSNIQ